MKRNSFLMLLVLSSTLFAVAPDAKNQVGTIVPNNANFSHHNQIEQQKLLNSQTWQNFTQNKTNWIAIWNEQTELPQRAFGQPFAFTERVTQENATKIATDFLFSIQRDFDFSILELKPVRTDFVLGNYVVFYQQFVNGFEVIDSKVFVKLTSDGKIAEFGLTLAKNLRNFTPVISKENLDYFASKGLSGFDFGKDKVEVSNDLFYVPVYSQGMKILDYKLAYKCFVPTAKFLGKWESYVDVENGEILRRFNTYYFGTIDGQVKGEIEPVTANGNSQLLPYKNLRLNVGGTLVTTDANGNYSVNVSGNLPQNITVPLQGPYGRLRNVQNGNITPTLSLTTATGNETVNVIFEASNSIFPERDAFYHQNIVHDFIKSVDPVFTGVDYVMNCNIEINDVCNAYWDGSSINFFRAGANGNSSCPSTARLAGVVYHEYGHGINSKQYTPFSMPGDMHEGLADYTAAAIENQPNIGIGFFGGSSYLRSINNTNKYPDDISGEVHNDGLIIGGAFWDLRLLLGASKTDSLWHFARYSKPNSFFDYFVDVLTTDDNDFNLANGTPNSSAIFQAFDKHGISSDIQINHIKIPDTENTQNPYTLSAEFLTNIFGIGIYTTQCSVFYSNDGGSNFSSVPMFELTSTNFTASIPAQTSGTTVNYFIKAKDVLGFAKNSDIFSFYVGPDQTKPQLFLSVPFKSTIEKTGLLAQKSVVKVFDNLGLQGVNFSSGLVHYRVNGGSFQTFTAVQTTDSTFSAGMDFGSNAYLIGDLVEYYFTINDVASTPNVGRLPENANEFLTFTISNVETIDGFEYGTSKWNLDAPWGISTQNYQSGTSSLEDSPGIGYDENLNIAATLLDGYNLGSYQPSDNVKLTFWVKHLLKINQQDYLFTEITTNNWQTYTTVDTVKNASSWKQKTISLNSFVGNSDVRVRFRLQTDGVGSGPSTNPFGVAIDNLKLRVDGIVIYGDADENGVLDENDVSYTLEAIAGKQTVSPEQKIVTDVDGDGKVRVNDASLILQRVKGLISKFPIE
ncbi:hypothetical protein IT568_07360 [bacterium]|nr:hypothetical protein [bacterium]